MLPGLRRAGPCSSSCRGTSAIELTHQLVLAYVLLTFQLTAAAITIHSVRVPTYAGGEILVSDLCPLALRARARFWSDGRRLARCSAARTFPLFFTDSHLALAL